MRSSCLCVVVGPLINYLTPNTNMEVSRLLGVPRKLLHLESCIHVRTAHLNKFPDSASADPSQVASVVALEGEQHKHKAGPFNEKTLWVLMAVKRIAQIPCHSRSCLGKSTDFLLDGSLQTLMYAEAVTSC